MSAQLSEIQNTSSWNHTQGANYIPMIRDRIEKVDLVWVCQFLDIIHAQLGSAASIKDIGCQAFQFYKEIKKRGLSYDYHGYELDQQYVKLGLEYFPELSDKVDVGDFAKLANVKNTDVTVCSATLEHIDGWVEFLHKMLDTTSKVAVIRTFLAQHTQRDLGSHVGATEPYPIWQFSFRDFLTVMRRRGFFPEVVRDRYTDSLPKFLDVQPDGIIRTQYVVVARKINP